MYRLTPLYTEKPEQLSDPSLEKLPPHFLEGELGDCLVVSVPETLTAEMCQTIRGAVMAVTNKQVLVLSHNVTFVAAERLSPADGARLLRGVQQTEEAVEAREAQEQEAADAE